MPSTAIQFPILPTKEGYRDIPHFSAGYYVVRYKDNKCIEYYWGYSHYVARLIYNIVGADYV